MTSQQRVYCAMRRKKPDRTPIFEYVLLSPVADAVLGRRYADYGGDFGEWAMLSRELGWENAVRKYAADRVEMAKKLGHDLMYIVPNPTQEQIGDWAAGTDGAEATDDPVERMRRRNLASAEAMAAHPVDERRFLVYELVADEMRRRGFELPIMVPAYHHGIWTDIDLMQTMLLEPETAHEHFRLATKAALRNIAVYEKLSIKLVGVGGDFAGNRPLISPAAYRSFIMPEIRVLCDAVHGFGGYALNTSDGDLWSVVDDFLIETNADGYMEIDEGAGMDLARLKARYGDKIAFVGNMDCGLVLSFWTPEDIAKKTFACLDAGEGWGHIFTASNAIAASVPLKNYSAMVNAYRAYYGLCPCVI